MHLTHLFDTLEPRRLLSGVTIITHGQGGSAGGDVAATANLIAARAGGASQYVMKVTKSNGALAVTSFTRDAGSPDPNTTANGEIIIKLDWSDVSSSSTGDIAAAVAKYLLTQAPTGHKLVEQEIALAGPSRGASVMSVLAAALGKQDVWVDQLTFLDPVPIPVYDPPMMVTQNVIFSDNYYRNDGQPFNSDPDGNPVDGSHNSNLQIVQNNHSIDAHSSVAAYYIATIDPTAPIVAPAKKIWFEDGNPPRDQTGFYYSRIAGGVRPTNGISADHGGHARRVAVKHTGSQWSNVDDLVLRGGVTSVPAGQWLRVSMRHDDIDSTSIVSLYLDKDQNPYNGNTVTRLDRITSKKTRTAGVTLSGSTVEASPGTYYLYAQSHDKGGHNRYSYLRTPITLTAPTAANLFASLTNGALMVHGTSKTDHIYVTADGANINATRGDFSQTFSEAQVKSITVDAGAGNDFLVLGSSVPPSLLLGGRGSDLLIGGSGADTLAGGAGKDRAQNDPLDTRSSIEILF